MANVVTDAELKLIEEAKSFKKAMAEQQALKAQKEAKKAKMKANYNIAISVLLALATIGILSTQNTSMLVG